MCIMLKNVELFYDIPFSIFIGYCFLGKSKCIEMALLTRLQSKRSPCAFSLHILHPLTNTANLHLFSSPILNRCIFINTFKLCVQIVSALSIIIAFAPQKYNE